MRKKHWVKIVWGESEDYSDTYYFNTEKELAAFLYGVEEGNGWLSYYVDDGDEPASVSNSEDGYIKRLREFQE